MELIAALTALVAVTAALTFALRAYALQYGVMDIPNDRSSHVMPTPRGGGIAIVIAFLTAVALLAARGGLQTHVAVALIGSGLLVALVGFLDDHTPVAPRWRWRLFAHFAAGVWALAWLGGLPPLLVFGHTVDLWWAGHLLAVVYLAWLLNLYNFMDGIDGIAGIETVTVCVGAVLLYLLNPTSGLEWLVPAALAATALGFLVWNWPPAKIFLGDAGSGFLGMMLGAMSIEAAWINPALFWSWIILFAVFVVDSTLTLGRRHFRGDLFYEAHRTHAYQQVAIKLQAHRPVSLAVGAINFLWLLPIALLVGRGTLDGVLGVVIAYVPLVVLALRCGAGAPGHVPSRVAGFARRT